MLIQQQESYFIFYHKKAPRKTERCAKANSILFEQNQNEEIPVITMFNNARSNIQVKKSQKADNNKVNSNNSNKKATITDNSSNPLLTNSM